MSHLVSWALISLKMKWRFLIEEVIMKTLLRMKSKLNMNHKWINDILYVMKYFTLNIYFLI